MSRRVGACMRSAAVLGNIIKPFFARVHECRRTHISMEQHHFPVSAHPSHFPVSQNTKLHQSERRRMLIKNSGGSEEQVLWTFTFHSSSPTFLEGTETRNTHARLPDGGRNDPKMHLRFCLAFFFVTAKWVSRKLKQETVVTGWGRTTVLENEYCCHVLAVRRQLPRWNTPSVTHMNSESVRWYRTQDFWGFVKHFEEDLFDSACFCPKWSHCCLPLLSLPPFLPAELAFKGMADCINTQPTLKPVAHQEDVLFS